VSEAGCRYVRTYGPSGVSRWMDGRMGGWMENPRSGSCRWIQYLLYIHSPRKVRYEYGEGMIENMAWGLSVYHTLSHRSPIGCFFEGFPPSMIQDCETGYRCEADGSPRWGYN